jgi:hypothetical protein
MGSSGCVPAMTICHRATRRGGRATEAGWTERHRKLRGAESLPNQLGSRDGQPISMHRRSLEQRCDPRLRASRLGAMWQAANVRPT